MAFIKGALLLLLIFAYIILGILLHLFTFFLKPSTRCRTLSFLSQRLSIILKSLLGIRLNLKGELSYFEETGNIISANHLSYLDGIILASLFPLIFITKLQVKSWPIMGWMANVGCTIFIDRSKKLGAIDNVESMTATLKTKTNLLFFPEGTSSNGTRILPFHHAYFQSALDADSSVIPITIQYTKIDSEDITASNRDKICWYGQVSFPAHLKNVLKLKNIDADITIHPRIDAKNYSKLDQNSRKLISQDTLLSIAKAFTPIK